MGQRSFRASETRSMGGTFWEEDLSTGRKWAAFGNDSEIDEDALYDHPMADWPPARRSGPEPLDPVQVPAWQKGMGEYQFSSPMGAVQFSDNEKRLALVAGLGLAAWFLTRKPKTKRSRR